MHFSNTSPLPMWHKEDYLMCRGLSEHCAFKLWEEKLWAALVVETLFKEETFEESKNIIYAFPHVLGGSQKPIKSGLAVSFGE